RELAAEPFRVEAGWRAADLADGVALPLAPGPFGGTTVLVVPEGVSDEEKAAWRELEAENVIKKRSRFANLKVAFSDGERTLPEVLGEIRSAGRSVTLIVPARFCASAEEMRSLRARTDGHRQGLRISWLPGLGGRLHLLEGDE
ncbi:MAG: hypothetical protein ACE5GW_00640, partial [Planctomycetota bacterium]